VSRKAFVAIDAGCLYTPEKKFSPGRLLIEGKTITAVGVPESIRIPPNANQIDASKLLVTPGFLDPHIHGCAA